MSARSTSRLATTAAAALALLALLAGPAAAQGVALDTAGPGTEVGLWASRLLNHLALAATIGLLLVPAWLLRAAEPTEAGRRAARFAALAALVWGVSAVGVLVFGLSNAAARPLPEALGANLLGRFLDTRFGAAVAVQGGAALVVAGLAAVVRDRRTAAVALGGAVVGALGPAWWGHAGTADLRALAIASDWLHIVAASVWVGGLLAVTVLVLARRSAIEPLGPTERFSSLAGWAILAVAVTGIVNTSMHTSAVGQLVDTTWGRIALAKGLLLLGLAALGWAHRRRSIPRLRAAAGRPEARRLFVRLAGAELLVMLLAMGLATSMASGLPAEAEAASRIQTFTTALGDGSVEVTLDPARTGANELHLYLYAGPGQLRPVEEAAVTFRSGDTEVVPRLVPTGPGHFTGPSVALPAGGTWTVEISIVADGVTESARGTLTVR
jgi:copper transport protein